MSTINIDSLALSGNITELQGVINSAAPGSICFSPDLADKVASKGLISVLDILCEVMDYRYETRCIPSPTAIAVLGGLGNLAMIRWALDHDIPIHPYLLLEAACNGYEEVVRFVIDNELCYPEEIQEQVNTAMKTGNWKAVRLISRFMAEKTACDDYEE